MVKLLEEEVQAIYEVDCAGTLIRSDIINVAGKIGGNALSVAGAIAK
jgi:hypothetical protein